MKHHLRNHSDVFSIGSAVTLAPHRAGWVRSLGGRAWLTRSHACADLILAPGAWQWIRPGTHWVIEPWDASRSSAPPLAIEWCPLPSRWASRLDGRDPHSPATNRSPRMSILSPLARLTCLAASVATTVILVSGVASLSEPPRVALPVAHEVQASRSGAC